jgi:hypothetical protein
MHAIFIVVGWMMASTLFASAKRPKETAVKFW